MNTIERKTLIVISLFFLLSANSYSQLEKIGNLLSGGVDDAQLMMTEYMRPLANVIGANLNAGWYNTADVHKLGGFHLNFTTSVGFAPEEHRTYDLSTLDLSEGVRLGTNTMAKTAMGEKGAGPEIRYVADVPGVGETEIVSYDHPGGLGLNFFPTPMINAGVGLIKGTEIMGRYMPTIKYGSSKANTIDLWGIGVKHDLKQWIPFVKRVPVLNLSVMYGYTSVKFHSNLTSITPADLIADDQTTGADWSTQNMDMKFQGHTANLLIGVSLPVVSFYGGAGISISKANLKLNGDFPVPTVVTSGSNAGNVVVTDASMVSDPFDFEIKNQDGGTTKPRLNAGVRFKFAVITLHFDYTYANYSVATAGLGIAFR